jgi:CRISPR-associated endonuclease/helicase Cas3
VKKIQDYLAKPNKTIKEHADDLLKQAEILKDLGYVSDEHLYFLLEEACKHHDDGKANPEFQKRVDASLKGKRIEFNEDKEIAHNILSIYYVDANQYSEQDYLKILCAILHHHNYCNEGEIIKEKTELIDSLLFDEYKVKLSRKIRTKITGSVMSEKETIQLTGLLHRCDYSASGDYQIEYPNDFLLESLEAMMKRWQQKNPESNWNSVQRFCMENREKDIIAIASTGMGKTEAALQWMGNEKGFFILPVRVAINAIYDRIKDDILLNEKLDERLALLHSESIEYYNTHTKELDIIEYRDRGKNLTLPLSIATLDQLFDFVLKYKGYETKLATLAYSKVVIDEIQMYDAELLAFLICGLWHIHNMGGKVAIVTATLSPFVKDLLIHDAEIPFETQKFLLEQTRHSVCVKEEELSVEDILECYNKNRELKTRNKILVVCNTIKKAQSVYQSLKNMDRTINLHIFHSRFTNNDKKELEQEIRNFGKTYRNEETKELDIQDGIWIATSLVEVSLDIDFDYLFTELSELNALFQRMGRCNRKGVKPIDGYNCFVYCDESVVKRGKKGYIDPVFYQLSKEALKDVDGLLSEKDKLQLIETYFTTENISNSEYIRTYKEKFLFLKELEIGAYNKESIRNIATQEIIPKLIADEYREQIKAWERGLSEIENELKDKYKHKEDEKVQKEIQELIRKRLDLEEKLKGLIVSIPLYEYRDYTKHKCETFRTVKINRYENVPIVECYYDVKGYRPLSYETEEEILMF